MQVNECVGGGGGGGEGEGEGEKAREREGGRGGRERERERINDTHYFISIQGCIEVPSQAIPRSCRGLQHGH